jgi:hypothetical protein
MNAKLTTIFTLGLLGLGSMSQSASASDLSRFLERTGIVRNNNTPAYSTYSNYGYGTTYRPQYVYQGGAGYPQYQDGYASPQYGQPPVPQFYGQPGTALPPALNDPGYGVRANRCHCGHCDLCCHHHHGPHRANYDNRNWGWNN